MKRQRFLACKELGQQQGSALRWVTIIDSACLDALLQGRARRCRTLWRTARFPSWGSRRRAARQKGAEAGKARKTGGERRRSLRCLECCGSVKITVERPAAAAQCKCSVNYETVEGTAKQGEDFIPVKGTPEESHVEAWEDLVLMKGELHDVVNPGFGAAGVGLRLSIAAEIQVSSHNCAILSANMFCTIEAL